MTEFKSGDVIWVKCGKLFWPAKVLSRDELPDDVKEDLDSETKQPKVIAKFFDEEGYEFLFDTKNVHPYNCPKKEDFIKKGVAKGRTLLKQGAKKDDGWFSKFPKDVVKSEELTGGDPKILEKDPYVERTEQKINYSEIFGPSDDAKKKGRKGSKDEAESPSPKKGGRKRAAATPSTASPSKKGRRGASPQRPIVHPRFRAGGGGSDHQVKIMHQPSTPYHLDLQKKEEAKQKGVANSPAGGGGTGSGAGQGGGGYTCQFCGFTATRLNVILMCQKSCAAKGKLTGSSGQAKAGGSSLVSPARKATSLVSPARGKGTASPVSRRKTEPAASESKAAKPKATPKKAAAPKAAAAATPAVADKPSSAVTATKRKQTTPGKADTDKTEPESAKKPAEKVAPPKSKKQRMTKKQKIEQEKKKEERKNILDEWGDDEEDESAEKKKINETLGRSSDDGSDDESVKGEGVYGDDNVHGYDDDDEEEEAVPEKKEKSEVHSASADQNDKSAETKTDKSAGDETDKSAEDETDKPAEDETDKATAEGKNDTSREESGEAEPEPEKEELKEAPRDQEKTEDDKKKAEDKAKDDQMLSEDIGKLLEETKVPELPPEIAATKPVASAKKSIKFSETLTKKLQQKKIQLVQAESNLENPEDVDDEFAESNVDLSQVPTAVRPILKHPNQSDTKPDQAKEDGPSQVQKAELDKAAAEEKSKEESVVSSLLALQAGVTNEEPPAAAVAAPQAVTQVVTQAVVGQEVYGSVALQQHTQPAPSVVSPSVAAAPAPQAAVGATAAPTSEHQEETYILLVDENSQVDSSQVLYLDPNSLANGNVLLMSQDSNGTAAATAVAPSAAAAVATAVNGASNGTVQQMQVVKQDQQHTPQQILIQEPGIAAQQLQQAQTIQTAVVAPPSSNQ